MSNAPDRSITLGNVTFANDKPLALIAGPCQLESRDHAFMMAGALKEMSEKLGIGLVYKVQLRQGQPHLDWRQARARP
jgi:2-dehydro-3-deoxyphosphooctonate aldolase (KDO 8-P synthase)